MSKRLKSFSGVSELAVVNTPKNFEITAVQNLSDRAKAFLICLETDILETTCDADGAVTDSLMKKGSQSGLGTTIDSAGAIPGTVVRTRREAANIFRGQPSARFTKYPPGSMELPVVDGSVVITQSIYQNGATAVLGKASYNGTLMIVE